MRKLKAFCLGLSALFVLASCQQTGGGKDKYVISISARSSSTEQNMLKIWEAAYEKAHPEVDVQVDGWGTVQTSEAYVQRYALNRSQLTNMIYTTDDSTALLAIKNNFVDLRSYYEANTDTDYTNFYRSMLDTTSYNGEFRPTTSYQGNLEGEKSDDPEYGIYFAPREYNMPGLLLNVDLFNEYGIAVPTKDDWDWDKFVALLQQIDTMTQQKRAEEGGVKYSQYRACELNQTWEPVYTTILKALGGDGLFTFDSSNEASCNLGSTANVAAYRELVEDFANGNYQYALDRDYGNDNFVSGTVFMTAISYPEVGNYHEKIPNIAFLPFPTEYVAAGCGGYGILTDKKDEVQTLANGESKKTVDLCWDFLRFIISEEGQNLAGKEGYIQPVRKSLATTGEWLQSFDPSLDHTAFCTGKELALNTFTFATPSKRSLLRNDVSDFIRRLLDNTTKTTDVDSIVANTEKSINNHLAS